MPGKGAALASHLELSEFLAGIDRRAYKMAMFAVKDSDAALDIVQDAMLKLAERYGARPVAELPLLFHRILQNAIRDFFRRQKTRSRWSTLLSSLAPEDAEDDYDPLEAIDLAGDSPVKGPLEALQNSQLIEIIEKELENLPERQRQAFLLRYWEEMEISDAALAMGCSEGSVKTHCSRATQALAKALRVKGIEL